MGTQSPGRRTTRLAFVLLLICILGGAAFSWYWNESRPLREARQAYAARDYELARRWSNWYLRTHSSDMRALRLAARSLSRLGETDQAEKLYLQIPQLDAEDYFLVGSNRTRRRQFEKAVEPLLRSLELEPIAETRRALVVVYNELGRIDLAIEQARILAADPKEGDLGLALLGELYFSRDLPRASYDAFAKLLVRNPDLKGVPLNRHGVLQNQIESLLKLAEPDKAAELLKELGDPSHEVRSLVLRGSVRQQQGDVAGAEADWVRAIELDANQTNCMIDLGLLCLEKGRLEEAVKWLTRAAEAHDDDPALQQHLAVAHNRMGNHEAATEHQRRAHKLQDLAEQRQIRESSAPARQPRNTP